MDGDDGLYLMECRLRMAVLFLPHRVTECVEQEIDLEDHATRRIMGFTSGD